MSKQIETFTTGVGQMLFMAAAKPLTNKKTGKTEYSIKLLLDNADQSVAHINSINDRKVVKKDTGRQINFTSDFAPNVYDADNNKLEGANIPFFDGRIDSGKAAVSYKVISYGDTKIIRLAGIKLLELNLAQRENDDSQSVDSIAESLKNIG